MGMSEDDGSAPAEAPLAPEEVADRSFPTAFRGFDPVEVRAFLGRVADELRRLHDHASVAPPPVEVAPTSDGADIVAAARAEADELVREAKDRVATLGSAATAETTRVLEEARAEAARIRATATDNLKGQQEEAQSTAVRKIAEAEREAAAVRVKAREEAEAIIEAARERGREMVAEAQAARERMLADLAKRKRSAQAQLEQLRAGRDRLLDTLKVARRSIDEMSARFEAEGGGTPPSSGTVSGTVTTTPSSSLAPPPHAQAAPSQVVTVSTNDPRPPGTGNRRGAPAGARGRAVSIGEAPPSSARPSIAAPLAAEVAPPEPLSEPEPEAEAAKPARGEERRSSALRILRRNRTPEAPAPVPPLIGRDSSGEGVRIIGPSREPDVEIELPEPEPDPTLLGAAAHAPASDPAPKTEEEPLEPLAQEEIRPRIEDLFARIRADREQSVASAREVLALADEIEEAVAEPAAMTNGVAVTPSPTDADERRLQARDAITEPLAGQLTRRLKRALQDEQNASLDRLRTSRSSLHVDAILSSAAEQAAPYQQIAAAFLDQAARAGAAASPYGQVAVAVDDLAAQLADDLTGAVRARLDQVLGATSDDVDEAGLSERISAVYREWKVSKVERLAVHYLIAAHERGGFVAQPEGMPLRWIVDDDGPCPDCEDNALAGPTPRGTAFPTGQLHPPAHVGCRCLLTSAPT
jgi:DivIVA domain-containing protein